MKEAEATPPASEATPEAPCAGPGAGTGHEATASVPDPRFALTRESLASGTLGALIQALDPATVVLTDDEHRASIARMLARHPGRAAGALDVWVFGYGSLIWNPAIHYIEERLARVRGLHRRFCLWTHIGRGTHENPGLTLALERGGSCRGIIYRIAAAAAPDELLLLWRREMLTGAYAPRWVKAETAAGAVDAVTFVINRDHHRYAGVLTEERIVRAIASAAGPLGPCATYLFETVACLERLGIDDPRLRRLRDQVLSHRGAPP